MKRIIQPIKFSKTFDKLLELDYWIRSSTVKDGYWSQHYSPYINPQHTTENSIIWNKNQCTQFYIIWISFYLQGILKSVILSSLIHDWFLHMGLPWDQRLGLKVKISIVLLQCIAKYISCLMIIRQRGKRVASLEISLG